MAKAKKPASETPAPAKKTSKKSATSEQPAAPAAPTGLPLIDTNLAAQTAARMLAARAKLKNAVQPAAEPGKESASFKAMKEHLQRPAAHAASTAMGATFGPQKSNLPIPGHEQVFHNQTTGTGVNRVNVPRRTAG